MKKCILIIGLVFLFVFSLVIPESFGYNVEISEQTNSKKIITVDNEPGDADFTSIKEALNYSNPGDIIEVYSGTYYENNIAIDKAGITLKGFSYELGNGNDSGKPFIKCEMFAGIIIIVRAYNVTITGFHMENFLIWGNPNSIIAISDVAAKGCEISYNDLNNCLCNGIYCGSDNCKILNNNISYSVAGHGIHLSNNCNCTIVSGNIISYCGDSGIILWGTIRNIITRNRISHCNKGIQILGDLNFISYNTLEDNDLGLEMGGGYLNKIIKNNYVNNAAQATFKVTHNIWNQNYWNESRLLPYPIFGTVYFLGILWFIVIPWVQFDWRPANKPYTI